MVVRGVRSAMCPASERGGAMVIMARSQEA